MDKPGDCPGSARGQRTDKVMRIPLTWTCVLAASIVCVTCSEPEAPYLARRDAAGTPGSQTRPLSRGPIPVAKEDFSAEVLNAEVPVLVMFWGEWSGPGRYLAPIIDELHAEHYGVLKVAKLNVDESQEVAVEYGVSSIPTLILFNNGREVARSEGAQPKSAIEAFVNGALE